MSFKSKQKTLFQSWKKEEKPSKTVEQQKDNPCSSNRPVSAVIDLCETDVDDDELLSATVALESSQSDSPVGSKIEDLPGFDNFAGKLWIYPTNYPVRDYQLSIVKTALFRNTLVALPTGLGKTFIASVVMYNYYCWYPRGKIIFMAPTKPLVSQQIEACYNIMGIPMDDQAQLTGSSMPSNRREELWTSKRVFFLTPQVINNDLAKGVCPAVDVKCIVIDEAHKALGNHAYCQVVQQLLAYSRNFRVLALSATPGSDLKSVQQVIKNLVISHIEVRSEESLDIRQYTHARSVEKVVVKLDGRILQLKVKYMTVIEIFINNLLNNKALYRGDVARLSKYALLMSRDQFRKDPPCGLPKQTFGIVESDFAISISLYHGLELLLQHGMKSFFIFLKGIVEGTKGSMRAKSVLQSNPAFRSIYDELTDLYGESPASTVLLTQCDGTQHAQKAAAKEERSTYVYGHPKMKRLEDVVVRHFNSASMKCGGDDSVETRVMIFCQYRDSVREITELLQTHRPLVRPMQFVGHAQSTNPGKDDSPGTKPNRRFTQKDQLMVVSKFRSGGYNTLVSTCVGEEGLDIGDVDLIVCFDSHKSPIRLVQRMGRTGRKRAGKIVMLVTEGKEERDYNSSVASRKSIFKAITGAGRALQFYQHSPRMVPQGLNPSCHKMFITVTEQKKAVDKKNISRKKATSTSDVSMLLKKAIKKNQSSVLLSDEQKEKWRKDYQLSTAERMKIKKLPASGQCLYLQKELIQQNPSSTRTISFAEWLPWQCRLQSTKFVEHSSRSLMLTEILEACDVIEQLDDKAIEMYFGKTQQNCDDDKKSVGIERFVAKRGEKNARVTKVAGEFTETEPILKRKRQSAILISSDEEDFVSVSKKEVVRSARLKKSSVETGSRDKPGSSCSTTEGASGSCSFPSDEKDAKVAESSDAPWNASTASNDLKRSPVVTEAAIDPNPRLEALRTSVFKTPVRPRSPVPCIADNLPPIFPTPLDIRTRTQTVDPGKEIRIPTPPNIDSLAFSFLDDFNATDEKSPDDDSKQPCFKFCDSDEEKKEPLSAPPDAQTGLRASDAKHGGVSEPEVEQSDSVFEAGGSARQEYDCKRQTLDPLLVETDDDFFPDGFSFANFDAISEIEDNDGSEGSRIRPGVKKESVAGIKDPVDDCSVPLKCVPTSSNDEFVTPFSGSVVHKSTTAIVHESLREDKCLEKASFDAAEEPVRIKTLKAEPTSASRPHSTPMTSRTAAVCESFDMSADMFAAQFDLDFDLNTEASTATQEFLPSTTEANRSNEVLGTETVPNTAERTEHKGASTITSVSSSHFEDHSPVKVKPVDVSMAKNVDEARTAASSTSAEHGQQLAGKTSCNARYVISPSIASSQTNRRENRALFADLSGVQCDVSVPVAKVKPCRVSSAQDTGPSSSPDQRRAASPTLVGNRKRLGLKRKQSMTELGKCVSFSSDEDDFVMSRESKRRCFNETTVDSPVVAKDLADVTESPVIGRKATRHRLLSTDTSTSELDTSLADRYSPSRLPGVVGGSPVLNGSAKQQRRKALWSDDSVTPASSWNASERRYYDASRKHSTPKVLATDCDSSRSDVEFSEKSEVGMRRAPLVEKKQKARKHSRTRKPFCDFIVDEADVSKDAASISSDEEGLDEEDEEMLQFVNDATQLTQHVEENDSVPNERAMYIRSVKSPWTFGKQSDVANVKGQYKLSYKTGQHIDVFSQAVEKDDSYEEDSFCVANDDSERVDDFGEITLLDNISSDDGWSKRKPKTRKQGKITRNMEEGDDTKKKGSRRRIVVCDEEDSDETDIEVVPFQYNDPTPPSPTGDWHCSSCTFTNVHHLTTCKVCGQRRSQDDEPSPERFCELCGAVLTTKGWLCKRCVTVMKESEVKITSEQPTTVGQDRTPGISHSSKQTFKSSAKLPTPQMPNALDTSREERIRKSRQRLIESRQKLERRRSGVEQKDKNKMLFNEGSSVKQSATASFTPGNTANNSRPTPVFTSKPDQLTSPLVVRNSPIHRNKGKLVVVVDNREVASGANRLVQLLRTQYDVNAVVTSLQCCDYAVGCRTAVFRKMFSDLSTAASKQKLSARFKQARMYFPKLFLIIEKDRVKQGLMGSGVSAAQLQYYVTNTLAIAQGNIRTLYSDDQDQSASIIHRLTSRERHAGDDIDARVLQSSDVRHKSMMKVCRLMPGVSYVTALYICQEFGSIRTLCKSSVDSLVEKSHMTMENAIILHKFLRKTFDLQMTPI